MDLRCLCRNLVRGSVDSARAMLATDGDRDRCSAAPPHPAPPCIELVSRSPRYPRTFCCRLEILHAFMNGVGRLGLECLPSERLISVCHAALPGTARHPAVGAAVPRPNWTARHDDTQCSGKTTQVSGRLDSTYVVIIKSRTWGAGRGGRGAGRAAAYAMAYAAYSPRAAARAAEAADVLKGRLQGQKGRGRYRGLRGLRPAVSATCRYCPPLPPSTPSPLCSMCPLRATKSDRLRFT